MIYMNEVDGEIWFSASESLVEISNVFIWSSYELVGIVVTHGNDDLLVGWVFGCYVDSRLGFV